MTKIPEDAHVYSDARNFSFGVFMPKIVGLCTSLMSFVQKSAQL